MPFQKKINKWNKNNNELKQTNEKKKYCTKIAKQLQTNE